MRIVLTTACRNPAVDSSANLSMCLGSQGPFKCNFSQPNTFFHTDNPDRSGKYPIINIFTLASELRRLKFATQTRISCHTFSLKLQRYLVQSAVTLTTTVRIELPGLWKHSFCSHALIVMITSTVEARKQWRRAYERTKLHSDSSISKYVGRSYQYRDCCRTKQELPGVFH